MAPQPRAVVAWSVMVAAVLVSDGLSFGLWMVRSFLGPSASFFRPRFGTPVTRRISGTAFRRSQAAHS